MILIYSIEFRIGTYVWLIKPYYKKGKNQNVTVKTGEIIGEKYEVTISNIEEALKPASDLITTKYFYTDADTYENYKELFGKKVHFTTDKVVFTYEGVVGVGIDMSKVKYEIDNKHKIILIKLPEQEIKQNEIDHESFVFYDMSDSILNSTKMDDYTTLMAKLKQKKEEQVLQNEYYMEDALENTQNVLSSFLKAANMTKDYEVIFK